MTTVAFDPARLRVGDALPTAHQRAVNPASSSMNKIHDDEVAREYGFRGGLVPGATTYAYLASYLTDFLGPAWPAYGTSTIALVRPVYDDETITMGGAVTALTGDERGGAISVECWADGPDGTRCAPATATLAWGSSPATEERPSWADPSLPSRAAEDMRPITAATTPIGVPLPPVLLPADLESRIQYMDEIGVDGPLFRESSPYGGPLVHPGWYPNICNRVVSANFIVGPWIHTRTEIRHLGPALAGGAYHAYGQFLDAYEKRGHDYAVVDVLITDGEDTPVARATHTAIIVVGKRA